MPFNSHSTPMSTRLDFIMLIILVIIAVYTRGAHSISCFNCSSVNDNYCPAEMSHHDEGIVPYVSCSGIYEAQYCVKTTGVNGGSLGTTRYCSSRDVGNYCEYIQRPGDYLEYRSCVYTCSSDGCNGGHRLMAMGPTVTAVGPALASILMILLVQFNLIIIEAF